ncbi:MAG: glycoside hydrolase family 99-like domain-containing protein, partial [Mucilaginibacter sp.]
RDYMAQELGLNSSGSYVWVHHHAMPNNGPTNYNNDYTNEQNIYFNALTGGGGANGLTTPVKNLPCTYFPNVTMGWDNNPRTAPYGQKGAVMVNNTPANFTNALNAAKTYATNNPNWEQLITINSWNEWGEGSYLEPEQLYGMGYLNAVHSVFP